MRKITILILSLLVIFSMLLGACAPAVAPAPADAPAEAAATEPAAEEAAAEAPAEEAAAGEGVPMVLMPKFLGILVFDQANQGAQEAHAEVGNPAELQFLGPTPENSVAGQIEILTNATTQGVKAIMISNNAGDQIAPAAQAARDRLLLLAPVKGAKPARKGK